MSDNMLYEQTIDQFHKSRRAPVPYPTIPHSEQKYAHFCSGWSIVGYGADTTVFSIPMMIVH